MRFGWFLCFLGSLLVSTRARADEDVQLWTSAGVRYRVSKDWRLEYEQHLRFDQDVSRMESVKPELGVSWKATDLARMGLGYRYSMERNKDDEWRPEHRLHVQGALGTEFGPVSVAYRMRFQERLEFTGDFESKHTLRHRIGAEVDTDTGFTPSITLEGFTWITESGTPVRERWRFTGGLEVKLDKKHVGEVFYRREVPIYDTRDPIEHIMGLAYQYRVPKKK